MSKRIFRKNSPFLLALIGLIITGVLCLIPTGYEDARIYRDAERVRAEVISVDNSAVRSSGLIKSGEQNCVILVKKEFSRAEKSKP